MLRLWVEHLPLSLFFRINYNNSLNRGWEGGEKTLFPFPPNLQHPSNRFQGFIYMYFSAFITYKI